MNIIGCMVGMEMGFQRKKLYEDSGSTNIINTGALSNLSLRGGERRSNLNKTEIATPACRNGGLLRAFPRRQALRRAGTPFGLAMTRQDIQG
jgi:hypothetical protein